MIKYAVYSFCIYWYFKCFEKFPNIRKSTVFVSIDTLNAADYTELEASNKLVTLKVIEDKSVTPDEYRVGDTITRREMSKVMMNLSYSTIEDKCEWKFSDLNSEDWGCKYAEAALEKWYIVANDKFRPDDNVTKIEALKMVMQAEKIKKDLTKEDWKEWYVLGAYNFWMLDKDWKYGVFTDYDTSALRWWIFVTAAQSIFLW